MSASWQRANIQAATGYLRERMVSGANDSKTRAIYEGLLEVLEPSRRATRLQREAASAAQSTVPVSAARERGARSDRRTSHLDRRRLNLGSPSGVERRDGADRRSGRDRRGR